MSATVFAVGGCGNDALLAPAGIGPLFVADCDGQASRTVGETVTLDWSGGITPLFPDQDFASFDLSAFDTAEGGTLQDNAELFKELVIEQIKRVFCESGGPAVRVRSSGTEGSTSGTTVVFTQALSPSGEFEIGEGEFDECNMQHDNVAVIFGERIRRLAAPYPFDDWVMVFANVAAHEIGHTLGFGHVSREVHAPTERALYVELMLDGHTMTELRREQRIITYQATCPTLRLLQRHRREYPTIACEGVDPSHTE